MRLLTIPVLLALTFPSPALCDAPKAEAMPSGPVLAYGDMNAACLEWSDGCVVCARRGGRPPLLDAGDRLPARRDRLQENEVTTQKRPPEGGLLQQALENNQRE